MSLEAACFSFVKMTLLNKVAFVTSDFCFCCSVSYTDVFQNRLWRETWAFKDPDLQSLSARLQVTILNSH